MGMADGRFSLGLNQVPRDGLKSIVLSLRPTSLPLPSAPTVAECQGSQPCLAGEDLLVLFFFPTFRSFNDLVLLLPKSGPFVACFLLRWLAKAHFPAAAEVKCLANGSLSGEYEGEEIGSKDQGLGLGRMGRKKKKR